MPENNLHLQKDVASNDMTEEQFLKIIADIEAIYKPVIEGHGATLVINSSWSNNTVNAFASQSGNTWRVQMFGGLARRPEVTHDGFALVVCHELGHHIGGVPFYSATDWASSEGQSDYYATIACAKEAWAGDLEKNGEAREKIVEMEGGAFAKKMCDDAYENTNEQNICYRSMLGGKSLADLLAALGRSDEPQFNTPDPRKVNHTSTSHPQAQCRLDTYMAGAACNIDWKIDMIPGKDRRSRTSLLAYIDAKPFACHRYIKPEGSRPRCWFNPDDIQRPKVSDNETIATQSLGQDDRLIPEAINVIPGDTMNIIMEGDGDADLYVRLGAKPTLDDYDCRPFKFGSNERCRIEIPAGQSQAHIMVIGWSRQSNISIARGIEAEARLCRHHDGGKGEPFPCWDDYECKLIEEDGSGEQLNWCIDY